MAVTEKMGRAKLSTTLERANYQYLESMVRSGGAHSMAEAVDRAVRLLRRIESRKRLEHDTAAYFEGLSEGASSEEKELEDTLQTAAAGIDFDREI